MFLKLIEGISFLGGFEADEPKTSEFFKLRKIRTLEKDTPSKEFSKKLYFLIFYCFMLKYIYE
ncbi:hypothetical protein A3B84_02755 [Candidatus Nomurabacteria bacterium RIFCSPHIGHO2_02_FULL_35_13]|uniref:Uncharacterized protein n=1 Tax=Candidatus Nomurabacteria bacterium RIFCSPHIGHO2_02_FULL_35_13 TaxID=1801748 RepID=A0A1F6VPT3_9BACT|nr:MAG: hypothetical protein A3B84_02755 [Candidatus Nomurabacteria bacterium RIFCSPHIGHO2_02_FULL_35_13]